MLPVHGLMPGGLRGCRREDAVALTVNLYSDTQSTATPAMRRAMAEAEVGDEQHGGEGPLARRDGTVPGWPVEDRRDGRNLHARLPAAPQTAAWSFNTRTAS
jgi:hypothetical protein